LQEQLFFRWSEMMTPKAAQASVGDFGGYAKVSRGKIDDVITSIRQYAEVGKAKN
jgi:hypothetical protein